MAKAILIPVEKLQEGFDKCVQHIRRLIEASELLYNNRLYSVAMPLTVLAVEEDAKLGLIHEHILDNRPITTQDWQEMTRGGSHKLKLIMQYQKDKLMTSGFSREKYDSLKKINDRIGAKMQSYEQMVKDASENYSRMAILDTFKQDCFYLGWKKDWWSFYLGLTEEEQEAIVWLTTKHARNSLLIKIISNRNPGPVEKQDLEKVKADPYMVEWIENRKDFGSPEHSRRFKISVEVVKKYRKR